MPGLRLTSTSPDKFIATVFPGGGVHVDRDVSDYIQDRHHQDWPSYPDEQLIDEMYYNQSWPDQVEALLREFDGPCPGDNWLELLDQLIDAVIWVSPRPSVYCPSFNCLLWVDLAEGRTSFQYYVDSCGNAPEETLSDRYDHVVSFSGEPGGLVPVLTDKIKAGEYDDPSGIIDPFTQNNTDFGMFLNRWGSESSTDPLLP